MRHRACGFWVVGILLLCAGCGKKLYPVEGKVVFKDGTPLPGGIVVFAPVDPGGKSGARGYVQADGTFRLSTDRENDGSLEGRFRVLVVPPPRGGTEDKPKAGPLLIDPRFSDFETSGLEFEVKPGKNHITIEVDKPGARRKT